MKKRIIMKKIIIIGMEVICILVIWQSISHAALSYREEHRSYTGSRDILILVESDIYDAVAPSLDQYVQDLEAEDWRVTVTRLYSGTCQEIKDYMMLFQGLNGVVFVGDIPYQLFEKNNYTENFPIDLFYMDWTGQWIDQNGNGFPDGLITAATGWRPAIWVGRLPASFVHNSTMDEVALIRNYFAKNHAYRTGTLPIPIRQRALAYDDDDWRGWFGSDQLLGNIYSDITRVNDNLTTTAIDYIQRLKDNFEWILLSCHSSVNRHGFALNGGYFGPYTYLYSTELPGINPAALFYNLNTCDSCRYNCYDSLGGHYIFSATNGLAAIGATDDLGMGINWESFYLLLGPSSRHNLGEAFKACPFETYRELTLLGDPTLTLDPPIPRIDSITPSVAIEGQDITFNGRGTVSTGAIIEYSWRSNIDGFLSADGSFVSDTLSAGNHIIFFKVRDDKGRWSSEAKSTLSIAPTRDEISIELEGSSCAVNDIGLGDVEDIVTVDGKLPLIRNKGSKPFSIDVRYVHEAASEFRPGVQQDINTFVIWVYTTMGRMPIPPDSSLLLGYNLASGDSREFRAQLGAPTGIISSIDPTFNVVCELRVYPVKDKPTITIPRLPRNDIILRIKRIFIKTGR